MKAGHGIGATGVQVVMAQVLRLRWDAQRRQVQAPQATIFSGQRVVGDAVERHVGQRMAQRREFPVQHAHHMRLARVEHQVAQAVVAVADRGLCLLGNMRRKPFDQVLHIGVLACARRHPLATPACDLPCEITTGTPVVGQPDRCPVNPVQLRQCRGHGQIHRATLGGFQAWRCAVRENASLQALHQVERRADNVSPGMEQQHPGHRHRSAGQCLQDTGLAVHGMGRLQYGTVRLFAQHHGLIVETDKERGVGLAAGNWLQPHRALQAGDGAAQKTLQPLLHAVSGAMSMSSSSQMAAFCQCRPGRSVA